MERALNLALLGEALGWTGRERDNPLVAETPPSPEELARFLAIAEISVLIGHPALPDNLISLGWYLHGVASSRYALRAYGIARQRAAFKVAAHIFDLALRRPRLPEVDRLKYCFASQIAYLRSDLDPNSSALYLREVGRTPGDLSLFKSPEELSLHAAVALVGMRLGAVFVLAGNMRAEIRQTVEGWDVDEILTTPLGAPTGVVIGSEGIARYLQSGNGETLERARRALRSVIAVDMAFEHRYPRWIAAHLLRLSDDLPNASIWTKLPPDIPHAARRAFAGGWPPVLTLWPPQLDLVDHERAGVPNPFGASVRRLFLALPTSSGKTTLSQLLILHHLTTQGNRVIYVAPTRSLCREVRNTLASRLRFLNKRIGYDLAEISGIEDLLDDRLDVEVMTPERLAALLRADSASLLDRVGLFVFDEVQNVNDRERGWTLEWCIAFLHYATRSTAHKIALISTGIGNQMHFVEWLHTTDAPVHLPPTDWRGPRRLTGIWTTRADWDKAITVASRMPGTVVRDVPLFGQLQVLVGGTASRHSLKTAQPIGTLRAVTRPGRKAGRDDRKSTAHYQMLVFLIKQLGRGGPVLVFEAQKRQAILTANAIAAQCTRSRRKAITELVHLVERRLGRQHPLCDVIPKGVAFHYGPLPDEIRNAIEDAFRNGDLRYLVATTTVAEGVNLPSHAVVIANVGTFTSGGEFHKYLIGSRLLNAIGRAGRATRETDGIVVLAKPGKLEPDDYRLLFPSEDDLTVNSRLADADALGAAEHLSALLASAEDSTIEWAAHEIDDFMAFIWFVADYHERQGQALAREQLDEVLRFTLGWQQLTEQDKAAWRNLASSALERYQGTPAPRRRRWATSGVPLTDATVLEEIVQGLVEILHHIPLPPQPAAQVEIVLADGRLERSLTLSRAPEDLHVYRSRNKREVVEIPVAVLIQRWMNGAELGALANEFFSQVQDVDFRYEQLTDFVYRVCEVYLPGVVSTVVNWANDLMTEQGLGVELPTILPAYIRWGVANPTALQLMVNGLGSRTLAMRIAGEHRADLEDIRAWLQSLTIQQWRTRFHTAPNELRLLLEFVREQRGGIAAQISEHRSASITLNTGIDHLPDTSVTLMRKRGDDLSPIRVSLGGRLVGEISSKYQADLIMLLERGLPLDTVLSVRNGVGTLDLRTEEPGG